MTAPSERWIQIVVPTTESHESGDREEHVHLPLQASMMDLLETLRFTSSPLYEDVRKRVLGLSGNVLAFGRECPALLTMRDQLARGGPVVIPPDAPPKPPS